LGRWVGQPASGIQVTYSNVIVTLFVTFWRVTSSSLLPGRMVSGCALENIIFLSFPKKGVWGGEEEKEMERERGEGER
jgi:hypothetical protein